MRNMAKALKVVTDSGSTYTVKPLDDDMWGAYLAGEKEATYVFAAPADASTGELTGELDYLEMTAEDTTSSDDVYDYSDEPYYA